MIARNIKGKGFGGCVRYVLNDSHELLEAEGVFADNAKSIIRSFTVQRSGRKEIKQPVGHIPISFSPEDKARMTNDFMLQLAKEYMEEMGIRNTQYIVVRHHNTENEHLHIVYNRIDDDLQLISVNNDFKRNIKVCKKLKDKHGLTYGEGKEKVKREKLRNPDKAKYYIYDSIKAVLPGCKNPADLRFALQKFGIDIEYKHKRTTNGIEGVSFRYKNIAFKGSQVDRKYSFGNLKKEFQKNIIEENKQTVREVQQQKVVKEVEQSTPNIPKEMPQPTIDSPKRDGLPTIGGIKITPEQATILKEGGYIYLENMTNSKGLLYSAYVITDDKQQKVFMFKNRPDEFVRYGKYEMRAMDKRLIEAGCVVKAKVKWWGGIDYQYPYLWKENPTDTDYTESWNDPRVPETTSMQKATSSIAEVVSSTIKETASNNTISPIITTAGEVVSAIGGFSDLSNSSGNSAESNFQYQLKKDDVRHKKKRGRSI
ncbi:relaxase/mobilization nuclease domain-containing protein [Dysgonomonas sp. ZJ709]|uniref:relaxase/mobilization nuclease domain-containing protein n=1 Tax=Dysgonomonas sp. ZJ709 TaxID=2709797 RepID=UPI0013EE2312|nr:relaxase/mobilization nuclease domain-containing protein [Dysgonomonas sp. ZJ709]